MREGKKERDKREARLNKGKKEGDKAEGKKWKP